MASALLCDDWMVPVFPGGSGFYCLGAHGCNRQSMNLLNLSVFFDIPADRCDGSGAFLKDRAGGGCGLGRLASEKKGWGRSPSQPWVGEGFRSSSQAENFGTFHLCRSGQCSISLQAVNPDSSLGVEV